MPLRRKQDGFKGWLTNAFGTVVIFVVLFAVAVGVGLFCTRQGNRSGGQDDKCQPVGPYDAGC